MAKEKNDQIEMPFPEIKGEGFVSHEPVEYGAGAPKGPMDILSEELSKGALDTSGDLDQNDQSEEGANAEAPGNVVKFGIRATEEVPMEVLASAAAAEVLDGLEEADSGDGQHAQERTPDGPPRDLTVPKVLINEFRRIMKGFVGDNIPIEVIQRMEMIKRNYIDYMEKSGLSDEMIMQFLSQLERNALNIMNKTIRFTGLPIKNEHVVALMKRLGLSEEQKEMFEKELVALISSGAGKDTAAVSETVAVDEETLEKKAAEKITTDPIPTKPKKTPFNPNATQPALTNSEREGGVALNRTTGPSMTSRLSDEGEITKVSSSSGLELSVGKYEVSGFTVSYDEKKGISKSVSIRDHFHDLETAFASVNVDKYLMPIEGGYKLSTITSGMPTISLNERLLYVYKNGKWSHI